MYKGGTFRAQAPSLPAQAWLTSGTLPTQTSAPGLVPWSPRELGPASRDVGHGITQTRLSPLALLSSLGLSGDGLQTCTERDVCGVLRRRACQCVSGLCLAALWRRSGGLEGTDPQSGFGHDVDPHPAWMQTLPCGPGRQSLSWAKPSRGAETQRVCLWQGGGRAVSAQACPAEAGVSARIFLEHSRGWAGGSRSLWPVGQALAPGPSTAAPAGALPGLAHLEAVVSSCRAGLRLRSGLTARTFGDLPGPLRHPLRAGKEGQGARKEQPLGGVGVGLGRSLCSEGRLGSSLQIGKTRGELHSLRSHPHLYQAELRHTYGFLSKLIKGSWGLYRVLKIHTENCMSLSLP